MNPLLPTITRLYETDYAAWIEETAKLLRAGKFERVDLTALIEEIESLGRSERRELKSRLEVLLQHLLKWEYQGSLRSNYWLNTIEEQRNRLADLLLDSPSFKAYLEEVLAESYRRGRKAASNETNLSTDTFPEECLYPIELILAPEFLP